MVVWNPDSRSRLRVAARDRRDRSGWICASQDKKRPLRTRQTPPMPENMPWEVIELAFAVCKILP